MTGETRVVRVRVTNIRELLQRMALLPEAIGEGLAKGPAKRWQGIGWERRQCARGADLGDQRNGRAPGRRGSCSDLEAGAGLIDRALVLNSHFAEALFYGRRAKKHP